MTEQWLIIWNEKQYNYKKLLEDINNGLHNGFISQQYRKIQKNLPKIDDIVYIKVKGCIIAKSIVINIKLLNNPIDKYDIDNTNMKSSEFCVIQIIKIYNTPIKTKRNTCMTNWTHLNHNEFEF